jgi:hypothetical protein
VAGDFGRAPGLSGSASLYSVTNSKSTVMSAPDDSLAAGLSPLELHAISWLDGFYQLEHLLIARRWTRWLSPAPSAALQFAALTHDAERFFPGGPSSTPQNGFSDADYLFVHSTRSADIVENWLRENAAASDEGFIRRVRALILRHEIGGDAEEDILQAADSLSFIESFDWLVVEWVQNGHFTVPEAQAKLDWMVERIRIPTAVRAALPLYVRATAALQSAQSSGMDTASRRRRAAKAEGLIGKLPALDDRAPVSAKAASEGGCPGNR